MAAFHALRHLPKQDAFLQATQGVFTQKLLAMENALVLEEETHQRINEEHLDQVADFLRIAQTVENQNFVLELGKERRYF